MSQADELLSMLSAESDNVLTIDNDLRTINIPSSIKFLGVESDEAVVRLYFSMPRMYGEIDLSEFSVRINYLNANNIGDVYFVDDATIGDDSITFSWLIGRNAVAYKGTVRFIICLKLFDEEGALTKEFNTTVSSLPVLEGLETSELVIEQNPEVIESILLRLNKIEKYGGSAGLTVTNTAAVGQTVKITAVDENGQPTEWEAVDMYSKEQIDAALGAYITDVAALVGGDA